MSLRFGMIGLDTSHVSAFAGLLNDPANPHHLPYGKVTVAFPGGSSDFELSRGRVAGFTKELSEKWGVKMVDSCEKVAEQCDVVLLESVDGRVHLEQFKKIVGFKKPTFIDKPLATCSCHAKEIFRLAYENGVPIASASAIRYTEALTQSLARDPKEAGGAIVGADAVGPMSIQPTQAGLYWYGIHTVDALYATLGGGCRQVTAVRNNDFDFVVGEWNDGRIGTVRGHRRGHSAFAMTLHREQKPEFVDMGGGKKPYYACMLEAILPALTSGKMPIKAEESIEVIRFIEAANESRLTGKPVSI